MLCMRVQISTCDAISVLSPGVPFYRSRRGTRLHGTGARVGFDKGVGVGQLEASIPAWLDRSCYCVLGDDGVCIPLRESLYIAR